MVCGGMWCCRSDLTGLCLFCALSSNRVDFRLFVFINFPIFTPIVSIWGKRKSISSRERWKLILQGWCAEFPCTPCEQQLIWLHESPIWCCHRGWLGSMIILMESNKCQSQVYTATCIGSSGALFVLFYELANSSVPYRLQYHPSSSRDCSWGKPKRLFNMRWVRAKQWIRILSLMPDLFLKARGSNFLTHLVIRTVSKIGFSFECRWDDNPVFLVGMALDSCWLIFSTDNSNSNSPDVLFLHESSHAF